MKKLYLIFAACLMVTLSGCNAKDSPPAGDYLPSKVEQVSEGGVIPNGYEAKKEPIEAEYPLESLWGNWIPIDGNISTSKTLTVREAVYYDDENAEYPIGEKIQIPAFPQRLVFFPSWDDTGVAFGKHLSTWGEGVDSYLDMNTDSVQPENTTLGEIASNLNAGIGYTSFDFDYVDSSMEWLKELSPWGSPFNTIYSINGNTLSIGLNSISDSGPAEFSLTEIDYEIEFCGSKMTLTYNDESITYIPESFENGSSIKLIYSAPLWGQEPVEGIKGIFYTGNNEESSIMYDTHTGYENCSMDFSDDGKLNILTSSGQQHQFSYLLSEECLTLYSPSGLSVYSNYHRAFGAYNMEAGQSGLSLDMEKGPGIVVNGDKICFSAMSEFQKLLDAGFDTTLDPYQLIAPGIVSDEIALSSDAADIIVKIANPWNANTPLYQCKICYVYLDDNSGSITPTDDSKIGLSKFENVEAYFAAPYEVKEDLLHYKVFSGADQPKVIDILGEETADNHGELVMDINSSSVDVLYHFDNGKLSAYEIQCPSLLYYGLEDNLDNGNLASLNHASISGTIETRNNVREKLLAELSVIEDIRVDDKTGVLLFDSNILFEYDSAELTAEGQQYLNEVLKPYFEVMLDESLTDVVETIHFEGHTDSSGSYEYNLELSKQRAESVRSFCLNELNLDEAQTERFKTIAIAEGYSFSDLIYDENGNEDSDASRRVAIKFFITPSNS